MQAHGVASRSKLALLQTEKMLWFLATVKYEKFDHSNVITENGDLKQKIICL